MTDILNTDEERGGYKVGHKKPPRHTQFQPGQSGNPHRGSARTTIKGLLNNWGDCDEVSVIVRAKKGDSIKLTEFSINTGEMPLKAIIAIQLLRGACDGDLAFIKEVLDRTEGKAKQEVEVPRKGRRRVTQDEEGNTVITWVDESQPGS